MGFAFLQKSKIDTKDVSVKFMIHRELAGVEKPRPHSPLRASDLLNEYAFCPREHAFMDMGVAKKQAKFIGTAQRITFDHGHYMEDQLRNVYLRKYVVGSWSCGACGELKKPYAKIPQGACKCGQNQWQYVEPRFGTNVAGVSGGIDFLLDTGKPKLTIVEVKTMAVDDFKALVAPLAEHQMRTRLYLYLASVSSNPAAININTEQAKIIYVSKSYGIKDTSLKEAKIRDMPFSPFKEFPIKRDDSVLEVPLRKASVLQNWRQGGRKGMPCGICPNQLTKRAQQCSAVAACFSGKYPSTITWPENGAPKHPGKSCVEVKL